MTDKKRRQDLHSRERSNFFLEHGKVPPQAIDIEEVLLGGCMLQSGAYDEIAHILNPEHFYKEAHQKIYNAIEELSAQNEPIDILTVTERLKVSGELEEVGGAYYITILTNRVSSAGHIEYHAYIIFQKAVQREMIRCCSEIIQKAFEDDYDQTAEMYSTNTSYLDDLLSGRRADKNMGQILKSHSDVLNERIRLNKEGKMTGISTGLTHLNRITNGWKPGELIIVAGRPGMGKTAVALNLFTKHAAIIDKNILFFSLEMDDVSLADRLICSFGGIDPENLKSGKVSREELEAYQTNLQKLMQLPIYIDDSARVNLKHIMAISRSKKRKGQCDMIVIDYLQLIETQQKQSNFKNREREVAEISRGLKLIAKELKIPVILLCQLNRSVESRGGSKRPMLADLRESGAIEQDADVVIFPYRPEYYGIGQDDEGNPTEGVMILVNAKNRNGKTGEVYARYSPDLTRFIDYDASDSFTIF